MKLLGFVRGEPYVGIRMRAEREDRVEGGADANPL
jgi:hypothetical protein